MWTPVHAQLDALKPVNVTPQPQEDNPDRAEKLEKILRDWEHKSSRIKYLHGRVRRTVYNLLFEEERVADGQFFLAPNTWRIDLEGRPAKIGAAGNRIGNTGQPFRLVADRSERWIYTGDELVMVDDEKKTFQVMPLPENLNANGDPGALGILSFPFMLFAMTREDLRRRFEIELNNAKSHDPVLIMRPKSQTELKSFRKLYVLIDQATSLPSAIKLFDSTETVEIVYSLESVRTDVAGLRRKAGGDNPFYPDLKGDGYKFILPPTGFFKAPD